MFGFIYGCDIDKQKCVKNTCTLLYPYASCFYSDQEQRRLRILAGYLMRGFIISSPNHSRFITNRTAKLKSRLGSAAVLVSFHCNNHPSNRKIFRLPFTLLMTDLLSRFTPLPPCLLCHCRVCRSVLQLYFLLSKRPSSFWAAVLDAVLFEIARRLLRPTPKHCRDLGKTFFNCRSSSWINNLSN